MAYAKPIQNLINALSALPSVGQRTAERYVFYLLKSGRKEAGEITNALMQLLDRVKSCEVCWNFTDKSPCSICSNDTRNKQLLCVVSEPQDLEAIESLGSFPGRYHVLRGTLSADLDEPQKYIKTEELFDRMKGGLITECLLALNHDLRGETTMMYLERRIKDMAPQVKVTRLARGLPMGSDLLYADEVTLKSAIEHRTS